MNQIGMAKRLGDGGVSHAAFDKYAAANMMGITAICTALNIANFRLRSRHAAA
jgi:hypothetical protein